MKGKQSLGQHCRVIEMRADTVGRYADSILAHTKETSQQLSVVAPFVLVE